MFRQSLVSTPFFFKSVPIWHQQQQFLLNGRTYITIRHLPKALIFISTVARLYFSVLTFVYF